MGIRGPGAKPLKHSDRSDSSYQLPTRNRGESRARFLTRWIGSLPVTEGILAGKKFRIQKWQREIINGIYGSNKDIRQAVISVPRKNGKTGLTITLALAHLCGPMAERRGLVVSAACDRAQATLVFSGMRAIIEIVPQLAERLEIRTWNKSIRDVVTDSEYIALSADVATKHGLNPSFVIYDELAQAKSRELFDVLATSQGARKNPLMIVISTQSADDHSPLTELLDLGAKKINPNLYTRLYAAAEDADIWSRDTWRKCNPALGTFRSMVEFEAFALQAQQIPTKQPSFRLLYLNQRVNLAERQFLDLTDWLATHRDIDMDSLKGKVCYGGLDLSSVRDLTAFTLYFPTECVILCYAWIPAPALADDRAPFQAWKAAGHLRVSGEKSTDTRVIATKIRELMTDYQIRAVAYDRWGIDSLRGSLDDMGINVELTPHGQGYKDMARSIDIFEKLLVNRELRTPANPVVTWSFQNLAVNTDPAGNRKFSKRHSRDRIDPIVASIMAIGIAERGELMTPLLSVVNL